MTSTRTNPQIQPFQIRTNGDLDDLSVVGAGIDDDALSLMLSTPPGVIYAHNQDEVLLELMFDMDGESIIAQPMVIRDGRAFEYAMTPL